MFEYLLLVITLFAAPGAVLLLAARGSINIPALAATAFACVGLGVQWEQKALGQVWLYPESKSLGMTLLSVPVEQYVFFAFTPVIVVSIYEIVRGGGVLTVTGRWGCPIPAYAIIPMAVGLPPLLAVSLVLELGTMSAIGRVALGLLAIIHLFEAVYVVHRFGTERPARFALGAVTFILGAPLVFAVKRSVKHRPEDGPDHGITKDRSRG